MSYSQFDTEDFVENPYFQAWVLQDDPEINSFWELWMELYPEKEGAVAAAIEILLNNSIEKTESISDKNIKKAWNHLYKSIVPKTTLSQEASKYRIETKRFNHWMPLAAAYTGLFIIVLSFWYFLNIDSKVTYSTQNCQIIPVRLPDGSEVMLNANSSISFKKNWDKNSSREVWLKGEAFFSVIKTPVAGLTTFTVHANEIKVQVLGTKFNVADGDEKTQVILNSGKIKLLVPAPGKPKVLSMIPGDYISYIKKENKLTKIKVNPESFSGWCSGYLKFNKTPLVEIIRQIEQTYGFKVILTNSSLLDHTFSGTFPNNNLPLLLKTLEKAFQIQINPRGKL